MLAIFAKRSLYRTKSTGARNIGYKWHINKSRDVRPTEECHFPIKHRRDQNPDFPGRCSLSTS